MFFLHMTTGWYEKKKEKKKTELNSKCLDIYL